MAKRKCVVLIDGSNFYFKLKEFKFNSPLLNFNFSSFLKFLAGEDKIVFSKYFIGAVRTDGTERTQKLFNNQRKLFSVLKENGVNYVLGYLLKSDGKFREKGVDVNIAVDILVAVYENLCDKIILVSSDTDLIPAIKRARQKGKEVEYVGFSRQPSLALIANCASSRLLTKEDLVKYFPKSKK